MRQTLRPLLVGGLLAAVAQPAWSQPYPVVSQPVVQAIPGQASQPLNAALARLGRNPQDVGALIDAGNAALVLGDVDAAVGFFSRADQIQPNSPRVRAGLAGALVHNGNPYDAIPLFAEAEAAGGMDPQLNSERGLAYDLVGDNATAQKYYRAALVFGGNDEATRRLGLSQAISGDRIGMETTLAPLLYRGDKSAQRVHAFALAIGGRAEEAVGIAYKVMPQDLAAGISPYLRYLPRLTRAQQAAAATFGHFPRASEIGRDDPRALRYAPPEHVATAESTLVPRGEPLGGKGGSPEKEKKPKKDKEPVLAVAPPPRVSPPEFTPRREESEAPTARIVPPTTVARPVPPPLPLPRPAEFAVAKPVVVLPSTTVIAPTPTPTPTPPPPPPPPPTPTSAPLSVPANPVVTSVAANTFDLGQVGKPVAIATPVVPPTAPAAQPVKPPSFAEAFGDIGAPLARPVAASGAVDVRKLAAARAKAEIAARPAHPSRIWVQLGTGRDKSALGFTWRGLIKDSPEVLRGKSPAITEWGRTNRLLTGPFETEAAASAYLNKLKKAEVDAFLWTSPAGQVVDPLGAR